LLISDYEAIIMINYNADMTERARLSDTKADGAIWQQILQQSDRTDRRRLQKPRQNLISGDYRETAWNRQLA